MVSTLEIRELYDVPVLAVVGHIDHSCAAAIKNILTSFVDQGKYQIILDLGDADGIGYMGLGILVCILRMLRAVSGDLRLARRRPAMRDSLRHAGIEGMFERFETAEEATVSFQDDEGREVCIADGALSG